MLFFARAKELAGVASSRLHLPDTSTVSMVTAALKNAFPGLATCLPVCRLAVNEEFRDAHDPVPDGSVIAVIPPVSGG